MTELIVLGSGCFSPWSTAGAGRARPFEARNPAGYALRAGRELLLFDLGFGNLRQLARAGLDPRAVTHAFFTHRHPDHVGDLPALLFEFRCGRPPASAFLRLYGPRGFKAFVERLSRAHHPWMRPRGYRLSMEDLEEGGVVKGGGWTVRCREVPHSTESLAFRFDSSSGSLCYSGDTGYDPGLAAFAKGADLFVLECTLPDRAKHEHHLRVSQALSIFQASGAKKGLMSHLSAESLAELRRRRVQGINLAADLMRVEL